jgi:DNA-binding transcriptional ArsR family regulator
LAGKLSQASNEGLSAVLAKKGLNITPSAAELLDSTPLSPEELVAGIQHQYPDIEEVTVRIAVDIVRSWPSWKGVSGKPLLDELKHRQQTYESLPSYLGKTWKALQGGKGWAGEIADRTGRSRSTESSYLNRLVGMNLATKEKVGRRVYFSPV